MTIVVNQSTMIEFHKNLDVLDCLLMMNFSVFVLISIFGILILNLISIFSIEMMSMSKMKMTISFSILNCIRNCVDSFFLNEIDLIRDVRRF